MIFMMTLLSILLTNPRPYQPGSYGVSRVHNLRGHCCPTKLLLSILLTNQQALRVSRVHNFRSFQSTEFQDISEDVLTPSRT